MKTSMVSTGVHTASNARSDNHYSKVMLARWLYLPACLYLVFVVYGSLVPLNFTPLPLAEAIDRFRQIRFLNLGIGSRADWVANGLLMIPLAFLVCGSMWGKSRGAKLVAALVALIFCATLGIFIEFVQIFFPPRTVSQNDVFAQTLGSVIGVLLWWRTGSLYLSYIERFSAASGTRSVAEKALWGYLALVYGYSLLPLDLTISPVEVYHKWEEGKVVLIPFSALPDAPIEFIYELLTDIVVWVPVSLLLVLSARKTVAGAILWTVAVAALLECLQLFVFSRVTDITDIFTALLGAVAGAVIARRFSQGSDTPAMPAPGAQWQKVALGALLFSVWAAILMLVFWYPYDFNFDGSFLRQRVGRFAEVPFRSYYMGTEFRAITELIRRIFFFMPLGAILFLARPAQLPHFLSRAYTACAVLAMLCVAVVIELGQTAIAEKFPSNTDVVLQFIGGALGFFGAGFVQSRVLNKSVTAPQTEPASIEPPAPLSTQSVVVWNLATALFLLFTLLVASGVASALLGSQAIPYNIRELVAGDYRWIRVLGLIFTAYWVFGLPMTVLLPRLRHLKPGNINFPGPVVGFITVHSLVTWVLVWLVFPLESIHDIVGAPVWESFRFIELTLRFLGLFLFISTLTWLASALVLSQVYAVRLRKAVLITTLIAALLLAYFVVIRWAGTDNIIELLPGRGRSWAVLFVPAYLMLLVYCGLSLSFVRYFGSRKRWMHLLLPLVSAPLGYWLLNQGLEQFILKYGKVFSAMQFLLSANRDNYLEPGQLFMRFCVAHYALIFAISLLQLQLWLSLWSQFVRRTSSTSPLFDYTNQPPKPPRR
ncbi:VanZ family protein [Seongchinamella sediminis]|uniref:VanZ family protein n=1 Tax=Seongchinamella sediminis TaxID=2283635 RepID=UPI001EF15C43|nr:VanZ family protein [Seongchinamella sediminis]